MNYSKLYMFQEEELDYETMREKNIRDNEAFFSSLGIQMVIYTHTHMHARTHTHSHTLNLR